MTEPTPEAPPPLPPSGYPEWDELELSRPPNVFEIAGIHFSRWLRRGAIALVFLVLLLIIIIGVPSASVGRSEAYRAACAFVSARPDVEAEIGPVVACEGAPVRYQLDATRARFTFVVIGEGTAGAADVSLVKDGVWHVTSASFVAGRRGESRVRVLMRGDSAPGGPR
jgi:hypothetical protein